MPQAPKVKFDLSSTVKEVAELNKALESLGGIAQNLFSNLGRLSQTFGTQIQGVQQSAQTLGTPQGAAPSEFITAIGQQQARASVAADMTRSGLFQKTQQAIEAGSAFEDAGFYRTKKPTSHGSHIQKLMGVEEYQNYRSAMEQRQRSELAEQHARGNQAAQSVTEGTAAESLRGAQAMPQAAQTGMFNRKSLDAIGVSLADVPRAMKSDITGETSKNLDNVASSIKMLNQQSAKASDDNARLMKETARILETLRDEMRNSSDEFAKAAQNFTEVASLDRNDPRYQQAQQELLEATGRRQRAASQMEQAQADAGDILGGGGGGGGGFGGMARRAFGGGMAIAGTGLGLYTAYLGVEQSLDQATYGARLGAEQHKAQAVQSTYQTAFEAADMTKAENVLKYRADMLYPDEKFKFIGTRGMENALAESTDMETQRRQMEARERSIGIYGTLAKSIGAGAAIGAGGGAFVGGIGAVPGAALGALGGALYGGAGLAQSYFASPYTAFTGELESNTLGQLIGGKDFQRRAINAREREEAITDRNIRGNARELMDAELGQNPGRVRALQEVLDMEEGEKYAATLVGGAAMTKENVLGMYGRLADRTGIQAQVEQTANYRRETTRFLEVESALQTKNKFEILQKYDASHNYERDTEALSPGFFESTFRRDESFQKRRGATIEAAEARRKALFDPKKVAEYQQALEVVDNNQDMVSKIERVQENQKSEIALRAFKERGLPLTPDLQAFNDFVGPRRMSAAPTAPTASPISAGESIFANLQMSPNEFIMRNADLTNTLNARATTGQTARAIRLGRSGLGNFGQLMGNLEQISAITGGTTENTEKLERVLTQAVAVGFDKSRMAQNFVRSTTQLSETIRGRNVEDVAQRLAMGAEVLGVNVGKADELSMRLTAKGMQGYEAFTRSTTGAVGAFKALGIMGAGGAPGANLFTALDMGAQEYGNALSQLGEGQKITDPKIAQMLAVERENLRAKGVRGAELETQAKTALRSKLRGPLGQLNDFSKNLIQTITGMNVDEMVTGIKGAEGAERESRIQAFMGHAGEMGLVTGMGRESGQVAALDLLREQKVIGARDFNKYKKQLDKNVDAGTAVFRNVGEQSLRRYIDTLIMNDASGLTADVTKGDLETYFERGGAPISAGGQTITGRDQLKGKSEEDIAKMGLNRLDLVRSADFTLGLGEKAQPVRITNFYELNAALGKHSGKVRENIRNTQGNTGAYTPLGME